MRFRTLLEEADVDPEGDLFLVICRVVHTGDNDGDDNPIVEVTTVDEGEGEHGIDAGGDAEGDEDDGEDDTEDDTEETTNDETEGETGGNTNGEAEGDSEENTNGQADLDHDHDHDNLRFRFLSPADDAHGGDGLTWKYTRIRVSSNVMTLSSPVFKAMLKGGFLEGQLGGSKEKPATVRLGDDHPDAMVMLAKILHHHKDIYGQPSLEHVCELATVSNKYDCREMVRAWFRHHILQQQWGWKPTPDQAELAHLIGAAYLLSDKMAFLLFTKTAIRTLNWEADMSEFKDILDKWTDERVDEALSACYKEQLTSIHGCCQILTGQLLQKASAVTEQEPRKAVFLLHQDDAAYLPVVCPGQALRAGQFIATLCFLGLWPGAHVCSRPPRSLEVVFDLLRQVGDLALKDETVACPASADCGRCAENWGIAIRKILDVSEAALHGLCLTCFQVAGDDTLGLELTDNCRQHADEYLRSAWHLDVKCARKRYPLDEIVADAVQRALDARLHGQGEARGEGEEDAEAEA